MTLKKISLTNKDCKQIYELCYTILELYHHDDKYQISDQNQFSFEHNILVINLVLNKSVQVIHA